MILTDVQIRERVNEFQLIHNFRENRLQSASYDLSASNVIQCFKKHASRITLTSQVSVDSLYEEVDIRFGYDLKPSEYILVKTDERITMMDDLVAHVRPRTSLIKVGLVLSHQHLNPTFQGCLYLGLYNASPNVIEILPGLVIGQVIFEETKSAPSTGKLYENKNDAKYQNEESFIPSKIYNDFDSEVNKVYEDIVTNLIVGRN